MALDPPATFEPSVALLQSFDFLGVAIPESAVVIGGVATIVLLIVLSAFFSSSEIAMFSLPAHRTEALVEDGVPGARTLKQLKSDPHRLLVTILVGNNLVNIAMSSISTGLLAIYLTPRRSCCRSSSSSII